MSDDQRVLVETVERLTVEMQELIVRLEAHTGSQWAKDTLRILGDERDGYRDALESIATLAHDAIEDGHPSIPEMSFVLRRARAALARQETPQRVTAEAQLRNALRRLTGDNDALQDTALARSEATTPETKEAS